MKRIIISFMLKVFINFTDGESSDTTVHSILG